MVSVIKLSNIVDGGAINISTDKVVAVRNGDTDVLLDLSAFAAAVPFRVRAAALPQTYFIQATYNNGASGVGATLTGMGFNALVIDNVALNNGDLVLVAYSAVPQEYGIYTVTNSGSPSTSYVLTRAANFNSAGNILEGSVVYVSEGTIAAGQDFTLQGPGPFTIGTSALNFVIPRVAPGDNLNGGLLFNNGGQATSMNGSPATNGAHLSLGNDITYAGFININESGNGGAIVIYTQNTDSYVGAKFYQDNTSGAELMDFFPGFGGTTPYFHTDPAKIALNSTKLEINSVSYVWPAVNAVGVLTSDISGNLSWSPAVPNNTVNTLAGYDNSGIFSDVAIGSGLSLSGGTLISTVTGTGTVTQVDTGTGLTGGPITTTGTISMANNTANTLAGFDNSGVFTDVTLAGSISLSGNTLTATGVPGTGSDNDIARWDGTGAIQDSSVVIDDSGNMTSLSQATCLFGYFNVQGGISTADAFINFQPGHNAGNAGGSNGRIRFNEITNTMQMSVNTGGYVDIAPGVPAGMDKYVQFNDSGVFGGSSKFIFDKSNAHLTIADPSVTLEVNNTGTLIVKWVEGAAGRAGSVTDSASLIYFCDGTNSAINVITGSVTTLGTTGNTFKYGSSASAPSTAGFPPTFTDSYGGEFYCFRKSGYMGACQYFWY